MEREKKIEIGTPLAIGGATLIPIIELSMNQWQGKGGVSTFGIKQPTAVVVVSASGKHAFRISGEEVPLDQLIRETPGLAEVLENI